MTRFARILTLLLACGGAHAQEFLMGELALERFAGARQGPPVARQGVIRSQGQLLAFFGVSSAGQLPAALTQRPIRFGAGELAVARGLGSLPGGGHQVELSGALRLPVIPTVEELLAGVPLGSKGAVTVTTLETRPFPWSAPAPGPTRPWALAIVKEFPAGDAVDFELGQHEWQVMAQGTVEAQGGGVVLTGGQIEGQAVRTVVGPPAVARELLRFRGRPVTLAGQVTVTGPGAARIEAEPWPGALLAPARDRLQGVVRLEGPRTFLERLDPSGGQVRGALRGDPPLSLLRQAPDQQVEVEGFVWYGAGGKPTEALLLGVCARVLHAADLVEGGQVLCRVEAGQQVLVVAASFPAPNRLRVEHEGATGWLASGDLDFQLAAAPPTNGLLGSGAFDPH